MPKKKAKKFIDLVLGTTEIIYFNKIQSLTFSNKIKLFINEESDYFILMKNQKSLLIYDKEKISLLQQLFINIDRYIDNIYILNNKYFLIYSNNNKKTKIFSKINKKFQFLKIINLPKIYSDKIIKYKNKLIFCTKNDIQIWDEINGIPKSCITILKVSPLSIFLMENKNILVVNERREGDKCTGDVCFYDLKTLKQIYYYEAEEELGYQATKIDEERFELREINIEQYACNCISCAERREYWEENNIDGNESFNESFITTYKFFSDIVQISDFNVIYHNVYHYEEVNGFSQRNKIIVFKKKNMFLYENDNYIYIYDLSTYKKISKNAINNNNNFIYTENILEKINDECFALIKINYSENKYKIEFYKLL